MKEQIREVPLKNIKIVDEFWTPRQKLVREEIIPYQEAVLRDAMPGVEQSHAIENFRIAAGKAEGDFYGMVFQDSDVYKWLEGAAYALTLCPDEALERRVDEVIALIEGAQQPDGYLNTYFTICEPEKRWQNLQECHELYCAGHLMEAAAAYYEATGKDVLLRVACRFADHIQARFGAPDAEGIPGHQEIELGLLALYRVTGKEAYRDLAKTFIDRRGQDPAYFAKEYAARGWSHWNTDVDRREYNQCHAPVREQPEAVGHSVRANYMYTAMAELAANADDPTLFAACKRLWQDMTERKMYLTGGFGASAKGEAYGAPYDLPNDRAYAETCASIAAVFFAKKMLLSEVDGQYADLIERALYNGILSGMQLDGKRFFYVNPLLVEPGVSGVREDQKHVVPQRPGWYACACCPTNLIRLIESLGKYAWDESADTIYSHLYLGQEAALEKAQIRVESRYPWEGRVDYVVTPHVAEFTLAIHVPAHVRALTVTVNGQPVETSVCLRKGYLYLQRLWQEGDCVSLRFEMPVRRVYANQKVLEDAGQTALMRGPLVYCFEGVDHTIPLQSIRLPREMAVTEQMCREGVLEGNLVLKMDAVGMRSGDALYSEEPPQAFPVHAQAIPYFAWGNRGLTQMRVWMLEAGI